MEHLLAHTVHAERLASIEAAVRPPRALRRRRRMEHRRRVAGWIMTGASALAAVLASAGSRDVAPSTLETWP